MEVVVLSDSAMAHHDTGPTHPERPARLEAFVAGAQASSLAVTVHSPRPATVDELGRAHDRHHINLMERLCAAGGGEIDADTYVSRGSWEAALLAAGAGLSAIEVARDALVLCAVRPPGHHAGASRAMGFCIFNNVAVTAAALVAAGDRVAIVDWDVHHGNGTQDIFFESPDVLFLSIHEWGPVPEPHSMPFYPGTGWLDEVGAGRGRGATINIPLPAASVGDAFRHGIDSVFVPALERFHPDWLLVSAGFDAHIADPLAHLGLVGADYQAAAQSLRAIDTPTILFAEGGYDLAAVTQSTAATLDGFAGADAVPPNGESPQAAWRHIEQARQEAVASGAIS